MSNSNNSNKEMEDEFTNDAAIDDMNSIDNVASSTNSNIQAKKRVRRNS